MKLEIEIDHAAMVHAEKNDRKIVGLWRQLVVNNENRDLHGFEYRKCIKMVI